MIGGVEEYLDVKGVLWYARPDVENPGRLSNGGQPWEVGRIDDEGARVLGDWMAEAEARRSVLDVQLYDERRAEDEAERRFYGEG